MQRQQELTQSEIMFYFRNGGGLTRQKIAIISWYMRGLYLKPNLHQRNFPRFHFVSTAMQNSPRIRQVVSLCPKRLQMRKRKKVISLMSTFKITKHLIQIIKIISNKPKKKKTSIRKDNYGISVDFRKKHTALSISTNSKSPANL